MATRWASHLCWLCWKGNLSMSVMGSHLPSQRLCWKAIETQFALAFERSFLTVTRTECLRQ